MKKSELIIIEDSDQKLVRPESKVSKRDSSKKSVDDDMDEPPTK